MEDIDREDFSETVEKFKKKKKQKKKKHGGSSSSSSFSFSYSFYSDDSVDTRNERERIAWIRYLEMNGRD